MNLDKTDVMWIGKQREELNIRLDGKDIMQVNNCVYHGGNISENGRVFLVWFVFFFSVQGSFFFSRIDALLGSLEWAMESTTVTHSSAE